MEQLQGSMWIHFVWQSHKHNSIEIQLDNEFWRQFEDCKHFCALFGIPHWNRYSIAMHDEREEEQFQLNDTTYIERFGRWYDDWIGICKFILHS